MRRIYWCFLLVAATAISGAARSQDAGRWGEGSIAGPSSWLPGFALRAESLFRSADPAGAVDEGRPPAAFASSLGSFGTLAPASALEGAAQPEELLNFYTELRAGPMFFVNDFAGLSPGVDTELAVGYYPLEFLAVELVSGFMYGADSSGANDRELWVVPIVANVKGVLPLGIFETYGGVGIGAYFVRAEIENVSLEACDCDWVFGGNVFLGVNVDIADRVFIGGEVKYILTAAAPEGNGHAALEGFALLVGAGLRF